jgi:hypothetical protein
MRVGSEQQPWQLSFTAGWSLPLRGAEDPTADRRLTRSTLLLGAGLVLKPRLFGKGAY